MIRYGHIAWRVAAVVAFTGTAALAVVSTRAPVGSPPVLSSKVTCATSGLQAWLGAGASTSTGAQGTYYTLEFTNVSHRTCRLYGYPEVSAYATTELTGSQQADSQSSAAIPDTAVRPQPVTLQPGATAHAVLRVTSTGSTRPAACAQVMAKQIRVIPPDQGRSRGGATVFAVRILVCAGRGHASLSVQPVLARPGIPGRTLP